MLEDTIPSEGSQLYNSVSEKERLVGEIRRSRYVNYGLTALHGVLACTSGVSFGASMSMDNPRSAVLNGLFILVNLGFLGYRACAIEDQSRQLERAELKQIREHPNG